MKEKHLLSETAVWRCVSFFTNNKGVRSEGFGESHVEILGDFITNKSWSKLGESTLENNYTVTKVNDSYFEFYSKNPALGIQRGTFHLAKNTLYSKFKIENTPLNGFEVIRREGDTCYADGALYDGDGLINTWTAIMEKQE